MVCPNPFPFWGEFIEERRGWAIYYIPVADGHGVVDPFCVGRGIVGSLKSARNRVDELILKCRNPFDWATEDGTVKFVDGYLGWGIYYLSYPDIYGILDPFCVESGFVGEAQDAIYTIAPKAEKRDFSVYGYETPAGALSSFGNVMLDRVTKSGAGKTSVSFSSIYVGRHAVELTNLPSGYTFDRWESIIGGGWAKVLIESPNSLQTWVTAQKGGPGGLQAWLTPPAPTTYTVGVAMYDTATSEYVVGTLIVDGVRYTGEQYKIIPQMEEGIHTFEVEPPAGYTFVEWQIMEYGGPQIGTSTARPLSWNIDRDIWIWAEVALEPEDVVVYVYDLTNARYLTEGSVTLDGVTKTPTAIFNNIEVGRHTVSIDVPGYDFDHWDSVIGGSWVEIFIDNPNSSNTGITTQSGGSGGLRAWVTESLPTSATVTVKGRATRGYPIPSMASVLYDNDVLVAAKDFGVIVIGNWYTFEKVITSAGIHRVYGRMKLKNALGSFYKNTETVEFELG